MSWVSMGLQNNAESCKDVHRVSTVKSRSVVMRLDLEADWSVLPEEFASLEMVDAQEERIATS